MTTNTTNSQTASIDTPEFRNRLRSLRNITMQETMDIELNEICDDIDAKLAQAQSDADLRYKELAELHEHTLDKLQESESRLAEIQRGVEGLQGYDKARILVAYADVIALLTPQGQADTSGLPG